MLQLSMERVLHRNNPWLFPILLFVIVCVLTVFKVSGSSVGIYQQIFNGQGAKDANLIAGEPRLIRSDEYSIVTPFTISQAKTGFKRVNPLVGLGEDMSVLGDAPVVDWSTLFKPQNWSFFILPLEQAFAFKWWILGWGLIVGCYFLLQTLNSAKTGFNILISLGVFFTPFVQWWYLSITIASLAYGFVISALLIRLTRAKRTRTKIWLGTALTYFLIAFGLLLYPPFQIACAIGVAAIYIGYLAQTQESVKKWLVTLRLPLIAGIISVAIIGLFLVTRQPVINAISGSVYPGHRTVPSGHFSLGQFFSGPFLSSLQNDIFAKAYDLNQSEASNFVMLWPFLLIPSVYLVMLRKRRNKPLPWMLMAVNVVLLIFAARLFLPLPSILAKVLLLATIPHTRLLIGMGFLGVIQIALLAIEIKEKLPQRVIITTGVLTFLVFLVAGYRLKSHFPGFLPHQYLIILPCCAVSLAVWALLSRRLEIAAGILLVLGLFTSAGVNPLYRGLGPLLNSTLSQYFQKLPAAHDGSEWVFLDGGALTNFLPAQGVPSYSTTYQYPQLNLWHRYDPSGQYTNVYNRYANVGFVVDPNVPQLSSGSADSFVVRYDPCNPEFSAIKHVLSAKPASSQCLVTAREVRVPNGTFYIYNVEH
jgi:hypothetical protein